MSTPTKVIGIRTRFLGGSGEHPYLLGHEVVVVGVIKGAQVIKPGVDYGYVSDDDGLTAAGGLDVLLDRLDVAPLVPDAGAPEGERPSFASSDVRPTDLELFASAAPPDVVPVPMDHAKAEIIRHVTGALTRTGRRYKLALDKLDAASLREVLRLLRDLEQDRDAAVRRARMEPWRR